MSTIELDTGNTLTSINAFNANAVIRQIDIPEHETAAIYACRLMLDRIREQEGHSNLAEKEETIEIAVQALQIPYGLIHQYAENFFFGERYNRNGLILAALCEDQIYFANSALNTDHRNKFDPAAIASAAEYYEEAIQMAETPKKMWCRESLFLANIFSLGHHIRAHSYVIDSIMNSYKLNQYIVSDIYDELDKSRNLIEVDTDIGQCLQFHRDALITTIQSIPETFPATIFRPIFASNDFR